MDELFVPPPCPPFMVPLLFRVGTGGGAGDPLLPVLVEFIRRGTVLAIW